MKKLLVSSAAALVALTGVAIAQPTAPLDVEVLIPGATFSTLTGGGSNVEIDGIASNDAGTVQYLFDSEGPADHIVSWDGSVLTVFGDENAVSGGTGSASAGDLDVDDAGNLYALIFDGSRNRLWSVPVGGFGSAVEMVAAGSSPQMDETEVDETNSRVIIAYNDVFGAAAEDLTFVAIGASGATPTVLADEATIEGVLATHPDYVDDTNNDLDMFDLTVQSDGDVIVSHGFGSGDPVNGTLLHVTSAGTVSMFLTSNDLVTAAGADPSLVDIGNVRVEALSTDEILVHCVFTSDGGILEPFIGVLSADGSTFTMLATETELEGDSDVTATILGGGSLFNMDGKHGDVDGADDYYFYRQGSAIDDNAALVLRGVRSFLDSNVESWMNY